MEVEQELDGFECFITLLCTIYTFMHQLPQYSIIVEFTYTYISPYNSDFFLESMCIYFPI